MTDFLTEQMGQSIKKHMINNSLEFQKTITKAFPKEEADALNSKYAQLIDAIMPKLISRVIAENNSIDKRIENS